MLPRDAEARRLGRDHRYGHHPDDDVDAAVDDRAFGNVIWIWLVEHGQQLDKDEADGRVDAAVNHREESASDQVARVALGLQLVETLEDAEEGRVALFLAVGILGDHGVVVVNDCARGRLVAPALGRVAVLLVEPLHGRHLLGAAVRRPVERHALIGQARPVGGAVDRAALFAQQRLLALAALVLLLLLLRQLVEAATLTDGEQLVVGAALDHLALVHDGDLVGVADRREAVGDGDGRPLPLGHERVERLLDHALARSVERARRLVEEQDGRLAHERARNRHALLLPAGELATALAHLRAVAVWQLVLDEAVRVGHLGRRLDLLLRRTVLLAVGDVLSDGAHEQHGLLPNQADLLPQPAHVERPHVDAVEHDRPLLRVVKPLHQCNDCRFSRSRRSAQCDDLPRGHVERVAVTDSVVEPRRVGKDHVLQLNIARARGRARAFGGRRVDRALPLETVEQREKGLLGL
mmetsp:Transcript_32921/g.63413  ORF Transcript_32921/g.63413 Transcript_32921/m.63413 type:complete len:466 (+) Transcript_32921:2663-4060(+)